MCAKKTIKLGVHIKDGIAVVVRTDQQNPGALSGLECHNNAQFVTDVLDTDVVHRHRTRQTVAERTAPTRRKVIEEIVEALGLFAI
jgi:hypothetical protein